MCCDARQMDTSPSYLRPKKYAVHIYDTQRVWLIWDHQNEIQLLQVLQDICQQFIVFELTASSISVPLQAHLHMSQSELRRIFQVEHHNDGECGIFRITCLRSYMLQHQIFYDFYNHRSLSPRNKFLSRTRDTHNFYNWCTHIDGGY